MFRVYRKSTGHRAAAQGWRARVAAAALLAVAGTALPAWGADLRLADDRLALRVDPQVARDAPLSGAAAAEVGLESMLRARAATPGPDVAVEIGHYGAARATGRSYELDQRVGLQGELSNVLALPGQGVAADVSGGYSVGDLTQFDAGTLETQVALRARPVAGLSTRGEIGWRGQRRAGDAAWTQGGHGRLGLTYTLAGFGRIGAFERIGVSGRRGQGVTYETGFELDFGPHAFSLSHRLDRAGRAPASASATAATYGWQVGPLGMALGADYTPESARAPATGFAGLAVTLGLAGPGPGALLDALR